MKLLVQVIKNRQHVQFLLNLFWVLFILPGSALAQFAGGSGIEEDPYQIATLEQLQAAGELDQLDRHFVLINDIDAGETADWHEGKGFEPIGRRKIPDDDHPFTGTFDGNGFTISNITINRPEESRVGLFGYVRGVLIKNITLEKLSIHGDQAVGGLTGSAGNSELHNIHIIDAEISGNSFIGGVIGSHGLGILSGSRFSGALSGDGLGGLVGDNNGVIQNSFANIEVSGNGGVIGGLVGSNVFDGKVYNSIAMGEISGNSTIGGLVGWNWGGDINASYAMVNVSGESNVGGLVGANESIHLDLELSYYARITESYASGVVSGNEDVGGLIGTLYSGIINSTYWDAENSGQSKGAGDRDVSGAKGLTTGQMTGQNAYIHMYELDFDEVWQLTEGYPVLAWQETDDAVDQPEVSIVQVAPKEEEYDYGEVETDSSTTRIYTLRNSGNVTMSGDVSLNNTQNGTFAIIRGKGDYTLEPDSIWVVEVEFRPESADTFQATLVIHHDAPNRDDPLEIQLKGTGKLSTSVDPDWQLPRQPELHQNHPNPFNPVTVIEYSLPQSETVTLQVYDVMGRLVETLVDQEARSAGQHSAVWDASGAASGMYLYRLNTGDFVQTRSMLLIK